MILTIVCNRLESMTAKKKGEGKNEQRNEEMSVLRWSGDFQDKGEF